MVWISRMTYEFHLQTIEYNDFSIIQDKDNYSLDFVGFYDHVSSFDS